MIERHDHGFDPRTEDMRGQRPPAMDNRVEAIIARLTGLHDAAAEIARRLEMQADAMVGCSPDADEREPATLVRNDAPLLDRMDMVIAALDHALRRLEAQAQRNCWALPAEPAAQRGRDVRNGGM